MILSWKVKREILVSQDNQVLLEEKEDQEKMACQVSRAQKEHRYVYFFMFINCPTVCLFMFTYCPIHSAFHIRIHMLLCPIHVLCLLDSFVAPHLVLTLSSVFFLRGRFQFPWNKGGRQSFNNRLFQS